MHVNHVPEGLDDNLDVKLLDQKLVLKGICLEFWYAYKLYICHYTYTAYYPNDLYNISIFTLFYIMYV